MESKPPIPPSTKKPIKMHNLMLVTDKSIEINKEYIVKEIDEEFKRVITKSNKEAKKKQKEKNLFL